MIELAVIGAGLWGPNLIRTHRGGRARVRWVVDPDPRARARVNERHPEIKTTATLGDALDDPRVSGRVATPTSTHYGIGLEALAQGKHLFIEKPMTADLDEATRTGAEEAGLTLMVGHVFVHNPAVSSSVACSTRALDELHLVRTSKAGQA